MHSITSLFIVACAVGFDDDRIALDRVLVEAKSVDKWYEHGVFSLAASYDGRIIAVSLQNGETRIWSNARTDPDVFPSAVGQTRPSCVAVSGNGSVVWMVSQRIVRCLQRRGEKWEEHRSISKEELLETVTSAACVESKVPECYITVARTGGRSILGSDTWEQGLFRLRLVADQRIELSPIKCKDALSVRVTDDGSALVTLSHDPQRSELVEFSRDGARRQYSFGPREKILASDKDAKGNIVAVAERLPIGYAGRWTGIDLIHSDANVIDAGERNCWSAIGVAGPVPMSFVLGFDDGAMVVVHHHGKWRGGEVKAHSAKITAAASSKGDKRIVTGAHDGSVKVWNFKQD